MKGIGLRSFHFFLIATVSAVYILTLLIFHIYIQASLDIQSVDMESSGQKVVSSSRSMDTSNNPPSADDTDHHQQQQQLQQVLTFPENQHIIPTNETGNASGLAVLVTCPEAIDRKKMSDPISGWRHLIRKYKESDEDGRTHLHPLNPGCLPHPTQLNAKFLSIDDGFVYSAYLDDRLVNKPAIRIIALLKRPVVVTQTPGPPPRHLYCHIPMTRNDNAFQTHRFSSSSSSLSSSTSAFRFLNMSDNYFTTVAHYYEMCENHAKDYGGWILTCDLPLTLLRTPPCHIYISKSHLRSTTFDSRQVEEDDESIRLPVYRTLTNLTGELLSDKFGVCIPPLFGEISDRTLTDFVELTRILGADHLFFYVPPEMPGNIRATIERYVRRGIVTAIPWRVPVSEGSVWYNGQLLAINDCLYRTMHTFKYVAFNDLDEFIVPHEGVTWPEMISRLRHHHHQKQKQMNPEVAPASSCAYSFKSAFFDPMVLTSDVFASGHHVIYELESNLRTRMFSRIRNKLIVEPRMLFELGIHHVSRPVGNEECHVFKVDPAVHAFVHHFRECTTSFDNRMNCQSFCQDDSMAAYLLALRQVRLLERKREEKMLHRKRL